MVISARRCAYAHSLSYHAKILMKFPPVTLVNDASTMADAVVPMMSDDTRGSSETSKIPLSFPFDARISALLTACTVVCFLVRNVRSESDPHGTGTRIAMPSNNPDNSGMVSAVACAAPVDVGIILIPAARPRRMSFFRLDPGESTIA